MSHVCQVLIVGGGVAGCSAAAALWRAGVRDIVLLECGELGVGVRGNADEGNGELEHSQRSGSAVMDSSAATRIKMVVTLFASDADSMVAHHGPRGAALYLRAAARGVAAQAALARECGVDWLSGGSLYVAEAAAAGELEREFAALRALGAACELLDEAATRGATGSAAFVRAIRFADDAIVDSAAFCRAVVPRGVRVVERCSRVVDVVTAPDGGARATLADGSVWRAAHAVVATGGLWVPPALAGVVVPCFSYLSAVPLLGAPADSANMFTWGFTHDWCVTRGHIRVSGADHFSARKAPRAAERCGELAAWVRARYAAAVDGARAVQTQYGVYSETPDKAPLVGPLWRGSAVHYLLGCNAWGQAILSAAALSLPAILGLAPWPSQEQKEEYDELLRASRFNEGGQL